MSDIIKGERLRAAFVTRVLIQIATLAQLVERLIRNQQVAGSIPAGGSIQSVGYS